MSVPTMPTAPTAAPESVLTAAHPLRLGTPEEFARLRDFLRGGGYSESQICGRASAASIYDLSTALSEDDVFRDREDTQSVLVRLFLSAESIDWGVVRRVLPEAIVEVLESLGLVESDPADAARCVSTVILSPVEGVLVVSDGRPAEAGSPPKVDAVYPAILKTTQRFIRLLPRDPCDDFLELCSGTGIAALIAASSFAKRAWAVDITERSTSFARFNAALNGISNVTALRGDAYDSLGNQTFDRIVAHPPYVPAFHMEYVFRDGGEDGEQVTRRLIQGIPDHLRPGGQFCCDCLMTDRTGIRVEQRVREMLGADNAEFDVVVAEAITLNPTFYYSDMARQGKETFEGVGRWHENFSRLKVEQLVFGAIYIQRRAEPRKVTTTRRRLSPQTTGADFQWLLNWRRAMMQWDAAQRRALLDAHPRLAAHTELRSRSRVQEGDWAMRDCTLTTTLPFATEADSPTWYARFLPWCTGAVTARDHLLRLKALGEVPADASEDDFASMLGQLVDCGFLELDEFPLPRRDTLP